MTKPIHAKPSLYAFYFEVLKVIAKDYGYNLVLHGSMNRDLDLIAIPWMEEIKPHEEMVDKFTEAIGGCILRRNRTVDYIEGDKFGLMPHGRINYIININRDLEMTYEGMGDTKIKHYANPQYYIDISVIPINEFKNN